MRLVTINLSCDWANCDTVAPENEGLVTEMTLAVDGKAAKTFSICKPHRDLLEENLHTLLARGVGETKKTPAKRERSAAATPAADTVPSHIETACRVPDCLQPTKGNVGLAQHLKKKHSLTIAQHDELYPTG